MTSISPEHGLGILIFAIGFAGMVGALALAIWALSGSTIRDSFDIAFAILWLAISAYLALTYLTGRAKRGAILLDCGPNPQRFLFIALAIIVFLGLGSTLVSDRLNTVTTGRVLFGSAFMAYWLLMALGRLLLAENGIWHYRNLLSWDKIESYEWQEDAKPSLILRVKSTLPFPSYTRLSIAKEQREEVSRLLQQCILPKNT